MILDSISLSLSLYLSLSLSLSLFITHTLIYSASVGAEEIVDGILDHHYYDENMVYRLVGAASEKLGKPTEFHSDHFKDK